MNYQEFEDMLKSKAQKIDIELKEIQIKQFYEYMRVLLEWNEKINLTAITDENEIILKHFIDCISIKKYIKNSDNVIDLGTGAGFPGIPLKIVMPELKITLVDSLNKRINFLNELVNKLELENIETIHVRAEELAKNKKYREKFDTIVSRAVAPLNVLTEYTLGFIKVGGKLIAMKGSNARRRNQNGKRSNKCSWWKNTKNRRNNITRHRYNKKYNNNRKNKKYTKRVSEKSRKTIKRADCVIEVG